VDPDIRDALSDIKAQVREGFDAVNKRIDLLVTKGEFEATVQRLDAQHGTLRRDFDGHERRTEQIIKDNREADNAIRTDLFRELEGFRTTTRWAIALAASAAAILVSLMSWLLNL
jgi:hypothetical protein